VETAVAERRVLELDYVDRSGQRTERRRVEPYGLAGGQDHWYLMAWCRLRGGGRSFRLDRMEAARVIDERAPERELHEVAGDIVSFARETRLEE
jgi:predicted DNA-binding transcriptional regulator YafY